VSTTSVRAPDVVRFVPAAGEQVPGFDTGADAEPTRLGRAGDGLLGRGLTLGYRSGPVVHAADVTIAPGTVTALVGPNGSGKSTLLRALARLHPAASGRVLLGSPGQRGAGQRGDGKSADGESADATIGSWAGIDALSLTRREFARRVALLTQQRPTPDGVTVLDLVGFGRNPHQGRFRRQDPDGPALVQRAMVAAGVVGLADARVDELSGGQLQRVWLASCLAQDTTVLLLDEPTNHLDLRYQAEMLDLIVDLAAGGVAVGVVLHDLNHAAEVADRVVVLAAGRVVADGPPSEVLTAELLTDVYQVPIAVHTDPVTGVLTTRPLRRCDPRG
jgi:iron complex transport system ATP-binding protein